MLYRHNSNPPAPEQGTTVPSKWHGSNRKTDESQMAEDTPSDGIAVGCPISRAALAREMGVVAEQAENAAQCAGTSSSAGRPAGGTTTVDKTAFGRQLLKRRQIPPLQIFPAPDQFPALPLQLFKLLLLSFGRR